VRFTLNSWRVELSTGSIWLPILCTISWYLKTDARYLVFYPMVTVRRWFDDGSIMIRSWFDDGSMTVRWSYTQVVLFESKRPDSFWKRCQVDKVKTPGPRLTRRYFVFQIVGIPGHIISCYSNLVAGFPTTKDKIAYPAVEAFGGDVLFWLCHKFMVCVPKGRVS